MKKSPIGLAGLIGTLILPGLQGVFRQSSGQKILFSKSSGGVKMRERQKNSCLCLEVKVIGKPYAGELQVRFDEGGRTAVDGQPYTGTKLETADTAKG